MCPIKDIATSNFKIIGFEEGEIAEKALRELSKLKNCYGIYFILNDKEQLLYIGKSKNLMGRIPSSLREKQGSKFAYLLVSQSADIHILEPYLILKHKPPKNIEFIEQGNTSYDIEEPPISNIIPFYEEDEE